MTSTSEQSVKTSPIIFPNKRHLFITFFNFIFNRQFVFAFLGWLNHRWHFLSTVFVMYPATEEYANAYVSANKRYLMQWSPWFVGFYIQNHKVGLTFVISSTEADFKDKDNLQNLRNMVEEARSIQSIVGADQISFSGILPGILNKYRIIRGSVEAKVTVEAIVKSETILRKNLNIADDIPVVILGGAGFIGRRVSRRMSQRNLYIVDLAIKSANTKDKKWHELLRGKPIILINIATSYALKSYAHLLWSEVTVLNEVYPQPNLDTINALTTKKCSVYHIVGLRAASIPPFPKAYRGGIPCCAGRNVEILQPLLTKLN